MIHRLIIKQMVSLSFTLCVAHYFTDCSDTGSYFIEKMFSAYVYSSPFLPQWYCTLKPGGTKLQKY